MPSFLDPGKLFYSLIYLVLYWFGELLWMVNRGGFAYLEVVNSYYTWISNEIENIVTLVANAFVSPAVGLFLMSLMVFGLWYMLRSVGFSSLPKWVDPQQLLVYGVLSLMFFSSPAAFVRITETIRGAATAGYNTSTGSNEFDDATINDLTNNLFSGVVPGTDAGVDITTVTDINANGIVDANDLTAFYVKLTNQAEIDSTDFPADFATEYFPFTPESADFSDESTRSEIVGNAIDGLFALFFNLFTFPIAMLEATLYMSLLLVAIILYIGFPFACMLAFFVFTQSLIATYIRQWISLLLETFISLLISAIISSILIAAAQQGFIWYLMSACILSWVYYWRIAGVFKLVFRAANALGDAGTGGASIGDLGSLAKGVATGAVAAATGGASLAGGAALAGLGTDRGMSMANRIPGIGNRLAPTDPINRAGRKQQLQTMSGFLTGSTKAGKRVMEWRQEGRMARQFFQGDTEGKVSDLKKGDTFRIGEKYYRKTDDPNHVWDYANQTMVGMNNNQRVMYAERNDTPQNRDYRYIGSQFSGGGTSFWKAQKFDPALSQAKKNLRGANRQYVQGNTPQNTGGPVNYQAWQQSQMRNQPQQQRPPQPPPQQNTARNQQQGSQQQANPQMQQTLNTLNATLVQFMAMMGQTAGAGANQNAGQTAGAGANQNAGQTAGAGANQNAGQTAGAEANQNAGQTAGAGVNQNAGQTAGVGNTALDEFTVYMTPAQKMMMDSLRDGQRVNSDVQYINGRPNPYLTASQISDPRTFSKEQTQKNTMARWVMREYTPQEYRQLPLQMLMTPEGKQRRAMLEEMRDSNTLTDQLVTGRGDRVVPYRFAGNRITTDESAQYINDNRPDMVTNDASLVYDDAYVANETVSDRYGRLMAKRFTPNEYNSIDERLITGTVEERSDLLKELYEADPGKGTVYPTKSITSYGSDVSQYDPELGYARDGSKVLMDETGRIAPITTGDEIERLDDGSAIVSSDSVKFESGAERLSRLAARRYTEDEYTSMPDEVLNETDLASRSSLLMSMEADNKDVPVQDVRVVEEYFDKDGDGIADMSTTKPLVQTLDGSTVSTDSDGNIVPNVSGLEQPVTTLSPEIQSRLDNLGGTIVTADSVSNETDAFRMSRLMAGRFTEDEYATIPTQFITESDPVRRTQMLEEMYQDNQLTMRPPMAADGTIQPYGWAGVPLSADAVANTSIAEDRPSLADSGATLVDPDSVKGESLNELYGRQMASRFTPDEYNTLPLPIVAGTAEDRSQALNDRFVVSNDPNSVQDVRIVGQEVDVDGDGITDTSVTRPRFMSVDGNPLQTDSGGNIVPQNIGLESSSISPEIRSRLDNLGGTIVTAESVSNETDALRMSRLMAGRFTEDEYATMPTQFITESDPSRRTQMLEEMYQDNQLTMRPPMSADGTIQPYGWAGVPMSDDAVTDTVISEDRPSISDTGATLVEPDSVKGESLNELYGRQMAGRFTPDEYNTLPLPIVAGTVEERSQALSDRFVQSQDKEEGVQNVRVVDQELDGDGVIDMPGTKPLVQTSDGSSVLLDKNGNIQSSPLGMVDEGISPDLQSRLDNLGGTIVTAESVSNETDALRVSRLMDGRYTEEEYETMPTQFITESDLSRRTQMLEEMYQDNQLTMRPPMSADGTIQPYGWAGVPMSDDAVADTVISEDRPSISDTGATLVEPDSVKGESLNELYGRQMAGRFTPDEYNTLPLPIVAGTVEERSQALSDRFVNESDGAEEVQNVHIVSQDLDVDGDGITDLPGTKPLVQMPVAEDGSSLMIGRDGSVVPLFSGKELDAEKRTIDSQQYTQLKDAGVTIVDPTSIQDETVAETYGRQMAGRFTESEVNQLPPELIFGESTRSDTLIEQFSNQIKNDDVIKETHQVDVMGVQETAVQDVRIVEEYFDKDGDGIADTSVVQPNVAVDGSSLMLGKMGGLLPVQSGQPLASNDVEKLNLPDRGGNNITIVAPESVQNETISQQYGRQMAGRMTANEYLSMPQEILGSEGDNRSRLLKQHFDEHHRASEKPSSPDKVSAKIDTDGANNSSSTSRPTQTQLDRMFDRQFVLNPSSSSQDDRSMKHLLDTLSGRDPVEASTTKGILENKYGPYTSQGLQKATESIGSNEVMEQIKEVRTIVTEMRTNGASDREILGAFQKQETSFEPASGLTEEMAFAIVDSAIVPQMNVGREDIINAVVTAIDKGFTSDKAVSAMLGTPQNFGSYTAPVRQVMNHAQTISQTSNLKGDGLRDALVDALRSSSSSGVHSASADLANISGSIEAGSGFMTAISSLPDNGLVMPQTSQFGAGDVDGFESLTDWDIE